MKPFPVRIGIDELTTGSDACFGFSFFGLPEAHVAEFRSATQAILAETKLDAFHGKDYKRRFRDAYERFLSLIVSFIRKTPQAFGACRLFSPNVRATLVDFCARATRVSVKGEGVTSSARALEPYFLRLACLAALSRELAPDIQMRVEIDHHASLEGLSATPGNTSGGESLSDILRELYNDYAAKLHPRTPLLPAGGILVVDDSTSELVQAADMLGNYTIAYMAVASGLRTTGRQAKAEIVKAALGDLISAFDPAGQLACSGDNLVLVSEGSVTFKAGWRITKKPADPKLMANWPEDDGFLGRDLSQS